MFAVSYSRTEAGIRKRQEVKQETVGEIEALRLQVSALEARVEQMSRPVVLQFPKPAHRTAFQAIEARALRVFDLKRTELYSNSRAKKISFARQFVMYWACRRTLMSTPQIARLMGGRDHTTVLHGKAVYPQKRALMGRTLREAR